MVATRRLLFGFQMDAMGIDEVVEHCRLAILTRDPVVLGVLNAAKVVKARADPLLQGSLMECDLLLADGQSIIWASQIVGRPLPERIAGIDVFERLLALAHAEGRSVYLLGARPEVLKELQRRLGARFPGLRIAGARDGYFADAEAASVAADIRACAPDMLFLGMTSPKKEIFLGRYGSSLAVPVLHGVGGSFDILAGLTRRAPLAWQRAGMEWAYRLLQEPRRLWWRYLATNTAFLALTIRELVRPMRAYRASLGGPQTADR